MLRLICTLSGYKHRPEFMQNISKEHTLCEHELVAVVSLHTIGIKVFCECHVGESHVQRHMDQFMLINNAL